MEEQPQQTSTYRFIQDAAGLKILDRMEKTDVLWSDILTDEKLSVLDFCHWLEGSQDRQERFSKIRDKVSGGV